MIVLFAELLAARKRLGRPMSLADAQIAAITLANGMALATRNTTDFADCGLTLVNPWQDTL